MDTSQAWRSNGVWHTTGILRNCKVLKQGFKTVEGGMFARNKPCWGVVFILCSPRLLLHVGYLPWVTHPGMDVR